MPLKEPEVQVKSPGLQKPQPNPETAEDREIQIYAISL